MVTKLPYFAWHRPARAVAVEQGAARRNHLQGPPAPPELWLTSYEDFAPGDPTPNLFQEGRRYSPFEHTGLFKIFSDTQQTPEGVAHFLGQFGFLGVYGDRFTPASWSDPDDPDRDWYGERVMDALWELYRMSKSVQAWDALNRQDAAFFETDAHVWQSWPRKSPHGSGIRGSDYASICRSAGSVDSDGCLWDPQPDYFYPWCVSDSDYGILGRRLADASDTLTRARLWLLVHLNAQLTRLQVTPAVLFGEKPRGSDGRRANDLAFNLHLVPRNLLGCMWLQFALAVEGNKDYRQCGECKKWFEIGSNRTSRSDKRFCTGTCKANHHRRMKEEVRRLHGEGCPIAEIALRVDRDIAKVEEWTR